MSLASLSRVGVVVLVCGAGVCAQSLNTAKIAARAGNVDSALADLDRVAADAPAQSLRCSLYASIDRVDEAMKACEAAATLAPASSDDALAQARAYGGKADQGGALTGLRMVGKIRSAFERAVQLNGKSVEALSDLGEFYVEAPGMVGGGLDKAEALVARLQPLSPARAHRLAAMVAAKRKDSGRAELEYRAELAVAPTPEAYVDLARFYGSQKQWDAAVEDARLAMDRDAQHGPDTLDAAKLLIGWKRGQPAAQAGLRSYLQSSQANVASYAKAHVLLGESLSDAGDRAAAKLEYQSALALAHDYAAARQGLNR